MGVISFWCKLFVIPNKVMHKIQAICRNFLWGSNAEYKRTPYVCWEEVCKPKMAGRLGFKNLVYWNQACNQGLLWNIASKKDILWVKWIHNRYLKCDTIWNLQPKAGICYYLRKILNNRNLFAGMGCNGDYSSQKGCDWLMGDCSMFRAYQTVWNKLSIPKHQFFKWLCWKNRDLRKTD
ncbi:hypothetical protein DM860_005136 [Cuscuta australis]|uniref:Reverse transcriptase zinc-binding domain-containing protein n=1 Tax=Cuscuta australis TaxID=267555 RepID=A0A328DMF6_9ASTE|nr:hypothetical protein DM860_005136 [Cuscuta australis]